MFNTPATDNAIIDLPVPVGASKITSEVLFNQAYKILQNFLFGYDKKIQDLIKKLLKINQF